MTPQRIRPALETLEHPRAYQRSHDIARSGALRLREAGQLGIDLTGAAFGTAKNGHFVPRTLELDAELWRIIGLYVAEGHATSAGSSYRLMWSFHPSDEGDLVDDVLSYWRSRNIAARVVSGATSTYVVVTSRLVVGWWIGGLGLGTTCYDQRIPDLIWDASESHKRALLAGMWRGDGSWSFVNRGPSVVLEYGTVSRELADGILRLLGDLGVAARIKVGRTGKSTVDTYWLTISGAGQIERLLDLVPESDRARMRQAMRRTKRILPTGYRRTHDAAAWARIVSIERRPSSGFVYSLEVLGPHTFVTTGGLISSNCFPKDSLALKQLAANSGYHFQLLNAVIEVNELQKRRVIGKLKQHLGQLRGKTVALLGLAFKPNTDDMREAPSIVLAGRLLSEGAAVRAWDPVADAGPLLPYATLCSSPLEAVEGADAAVIVTEWPELRELRLDEARMAMRNALIVDGRNFLDPDEVRRAGFAYEGIGRAGSPLAGLPETDEPRQAELQQ